MYLKALFIMTPITFSKQIDYKTYMRLALRISFNSWTLRIIYIICFVAILISLTYSEIPTNAAIFLVMLCVGIMFIVPLRAYGLAANRYKSSPHAGEKSFWEIDENGIEIKSSVSVTQIKWNMVIRITSTKHWIFIWYSNSQYSYLPKNTITSDELREIKKMFFSNKKLRESANN
ncbi:MAG: YcxB family protein [Bacteroidetes bacterium]|jgi:hypothetical protein|nr:YcxB family protein [Bacteroidota bacterium]